MSFRCEKCGKAQKPRTKPIRVVTEMRDKVYPQRFDDEDNIIDSGGVGREIVSEIQICLECKEE